MAEAARVPTASPLYRVAASTALGLLGLQGWQVSLEGLGHVPSTGGVVIAANHNSFWDYFVVAAGPYGRLRRPARILAKQSLFDAPLFGPLMRAAGHVPVRRGSGRAALVHAVDALRRGELVLVLPEQTIPPSFELVDFRPGAARMAIMAGAPLVPAVSWGTHRFHTVGRGPRPRWHLPVTVAYGPPLRPGPDDDAREVTAELRRRMQAMLDRSIAEYPDGAPEGAWWVPARFGGGAPTPDAAARYLDSIRHRWHRREAGAGRATPRDSLPWARFDVSATFPGAGHDLHRVGQ